jgi:cysteine peptidase C11 family protein
VRRGENTGDGTDGKSVSVRRIRVVGGPKFHRALFRSTITRALKTRAIAYDDNAEDFLDNVELQKVLAAVRKKLGHKLDLLGMDACLMSMIEIGYQLRQHVGLTVGSEETEPGDGWPYNTILRDLAKRPQMPARDLASLVVRRYIESYDSRSNITQAACDLARSENLGQAIDGLAITLKAEMADPSVKTAILTARSQVQSYEKPEYVDLHDLCALIAANCQSKKVRAACAKVQQVITKGGYVVANGSKGTAVANSHGVSIYFPDRATSISAPISPLYANLDFAKKLKWTDFLTAWLQSLKRGARR